MSRPDPSPARRFWLLGPLRVERASQTIRISGSKAQSLLAFLLLHPDTPHTREYLANLLWPDGSPARVRRNLSDVLYRLRQALGPDWLAVTGDRLLLPAKLDLWVDAWEFERLAQQADPAALQQAAALYTGDLLPEIYDDWILIWRVNLRERYLALLEKLIERCQAQNDLPQALRYIRHLLTAEPLHEQNHQTYLRLLGRLNRHNEALAHYNYLRQLLQQELGLEPMPETQAIAAAIRQELALADMSLPPAERTPFVGRTQERTLLLEAVEAALAGQGGLIAVEGEAGIGKSRLLREVTAGARWRGASVATGRAVEQPAPSHLLPLAEALAGALAGPVSGQLETFLPAPTLARLAPLYPAWRGQANLPGLPPAQAQALFHQALNELVQALHSIKPHVLIFDDLHWAEPLFWAALDALVPLLSQSRLLLLLAYRRPEIEQNPGWDMLRRWEREGGMKVISLAPLAEAELASILPSHLQPQTRQILAATGGNPFFITEMLIALAEGRRPHGNLVQARAELLPGAARSALEVAAVLGSHFSHRLWAVLADLPPHTLAEAGEQLTAGYFLQPTAAGYSFSHDLVQAAIYSRLKPGRRRQLHRQAAHHLAQLDPENLRARAFHLDQAKAYSEAAPLYRQAGEQDLDGFAFKEAQLAFERALALLAPTASPERVETLLALAQACAVTGERRRQEAALAEALQMAQQLADPLLTIRLLLQSGHFASQTGQVEQAATYLSQALALAEQQNHVTYRLEAIFLLGDLAARRGQLSHAQELFETALNLAQKTGDAPGEARALRGLGIASRQMGQIEQAVTWLEKALAVQRRIDDRFGASVSQVNLLGAFYFLGAWDRLLALADEAMAVKQALGDRLGLAIVRQMKGLAAYALGDFETARPILELAIRDCEAVGERRTAGLTLNVLGLVAEGEENWAEAQSHYEKALAIAGEVKAELEAAYARHDLGALYLRLNQPARAIPLLDAARAVWLAQDNRLLCLKTEAYLGLARLALGQETEARELAETGWATFQQGLPEGEQRQVWLWVLHRLLAALQRPQPADQLLKAAYAELQRQAASIAEPTLRHNFFTRAPFNRAIVTAYDQLAGNIRQITRNLARQDAPLGRPLAEAELVTISWTVSAPEDEAITAKAARRRYRLQRLLQEAMAQGAAPTDDDLAMALGVSRRTILRDIEHLARSGFSFITRRRAGQ